MILILALFIICVLMMIENKKIRNDNESLKNELNIIDSCRYVYTENDNINKNRVIESKVSFAGLFDDIDLFIDDQLDFDSKELIVYEFKGKCLEKYNMDLKKIGKIVMQDHTRDKKYKVFELHRLRVEKRYLRHGLGSRLVERGIEWAKLRGASKIILTLGPDTTIITKDELIQFYSRFGFKLVELNMMSMEITNALT